MTKACRKQNSTSIQLFQERLSYKQRKAYAKMSKVIMRNGSFYGCLIEPQEVSAWWKETAEIHVFLFSRSLLLNHLEPTSSKNLTLTTHNANRHCCVCFYNFVGQPLLKQLCMK